VTTLATLADLHARAGQEIGTSDWLVIDQQRINAFADATGDHQWIHVDAEGAARQTPFGTTIAHGFLTLSLMSALMRHTVSVGGLRMTINYGLNRVRFVSPVPSGSRVRAVVALGAVEEVKDATQATWTVTVEREGGDKPALIAEWLVRYYPQETHEGHEGQPG
jgi:acyl dehydratase